MFRRRHKHDLQKVREVKSVYSDQIILENSLAQCECELYLPEPNINLTTGQVSYLYRDSGTVMLGRNCLVYLCQIPVPYSPSETTLLLKDIGQENEVSFTSDIQQPLQTVWTQIRPDKMSGLIGIQIV